MQCQMLFRPGACPQARGAIDGMDIAHLIDRDCQDRSDVVSEAEAIDIGDDVALSTLRVGEGATTVVFIHGYSMSKDCWARVLPYFPAQTYSCVAYDLRGFGDSAKPETGYTMHQHALDLAARLDALKVEKAILIGHSLGGAISQYFATMFPERTVAVVSCSAFAQFNELPGIDDARLQRANSFGTIEQNRQILERAIERYFDPRNVEPDTFARFTEIALKSSTTALRDQFIDAYAAPSIAKEKFEALAIPLLALTGANDVAVPAQHAIDLADVVPDSELAVMPRCGHTPMWERPSEWARIVLEFLDRRVLATRES